MTNILIIENDLDFALALKSRLEEDEHLNVVSLVQNEESAVSFITSQTLANIDCVVLDLIIPKHDTDRCASSRSGLHILKELRTTHRFYGSVIILTSSADSCDGRNALAGGCDAYLCKPAHSSDIKSLISELKIAISGKVMVVSSQMRHIFWRDEISPKEAELIELLIQGKHWSDIARSLDYSSPKAAANTADRIFDKLIPEQDRQLLACSALRKKTSPWIFGNADTSREWLKQQASTNCSFDMNSPRNQTHLTEILNVQDTMTTAWFHSFAAVNPPYETSLISML